MSLELKLETVVCLEPTMQKVRFWVWHKSSPVKLTVSLFELLEVKEDTRLKSYFYDGTGVSYAELYDEEGENFDSGYCDLTNITSGPESGGIKYPLWEHNIQEFTRGDE